MSKEINEKIKKCVETLIDNFDELSWRNEATCQHELGYILRQCFDKSDIKISFERNIKDIIKNVENKKFLKKEMDLFISNDKENFKSVIELKFILKKNGRTPENMYDFCKDIAFLESLVDKGFNKSYFLGIVEKSSGMIQSGKKVGIYEYFIKENPTILGKIYKPTGKNKDEFIKIKGKYIITWITINDEWLYCLIEVE